MASVVGNQAGPAPAAPGTTPPAESAVPPMRPVSAIKDQVRGAVVALFVIFLTYMSAKSWRWVHVTFMFLTFVAAFVFCIYSAMVLKTRAKWVN